MKQRTRPDFWGTEEAEVQIWDMLVEGSIGHNCNKAEGGEGGEGGGENAMALVNEQ